MSIKMSNSKQDFLGTIFFSSTVIWVERVITKLVRNMSDIDSEGQLSRLAKNEKHGV